MPTLDELISGMLSDVKKKKAARSTAKEKKKSLLTQKVIGRSDVGPAPILNPWETEHLVLLVHIHTCKACNHSSVSWNDHLLLERKRTVHGREEKHFTKIQKCDFEQLYFQYPQRMETREVETVACPYCFGITKPVSPLQLPLPLGEH